MELTMMKLLQSDVIFYSELQILWTANKLNLSEPNGKCRSQQKKGDEKTMQNDKMNAHIKSCSCNEFIRLWIITRNELFIDNIDHFIAETIQHHIEKIKNDSFMECMT